MGETPSRIDAEKVAALYGTQVAGNLNLALGESRSERIPVHKPPRNLPERQKTFAGREAELLELHQELSANADVGITQQTAVHGHGGVGKTSIATEYGWRHLEDYPGGVFFLSCEASPGAPRLEELAPHLGLSALGTPEETAQRVRAHLETGEPSLLILDNVRGPEQCLAEDWTQNLPAGACRRLITTRSENLPGVHMYRLQRLSRDDGVKLLAEYREDAPQEEALAARIVEWFDGLAVGLTVVGVYMQMNQGLSWQRYVDSLEAKGLGTVRRTEVAAGSLLRYQRRVDAVFDDVLDSLPVEVKRALEYAALLPEDNVYAPWLVELLDKEEMEVADLPGYEGRTGERAVEALVRQQLLRPRGEDTLVLGLHRVLRRRAGERLDNKGSRDAAVDHLVELAMSRGSTSRAALTDVGLRRELTPLASLAREFGVLGRRVAAVNLASWIAAPLRELGRSREGRDLLAGLEAAGVLEGVSDNEIGTFQNEFAQILRDLRELKEARERMERAVHIGEHNLPKNHPTLATRYSNLALILKDLRELMEARDRMERAIEIFESSFPEGHPTLAASYSNLATILGDLGELKEARERMERAVQIDEANFPEDHPSLGIRYNNLAYIEWNLGRTDIACTLFQRSRAILLKHFKHDHRYIVSVSASIQEVCGDGGTPPDAAP